MFSSFLLPSLLISSLLNSRQHPVGGNVGGNVVGRKFLQKSRICTEVRCCTFTTNGNKTPICFKFKIYISGGLHKYHKSCRTWRDHCYIFGARFRPQKPHRPPISKLVTKKLNKKLEEQRTLLLYQKLALQHQCRSVSLQ